MDAPEVDASESVAGSLTFLLGKLGGLAAARFAGKLAPQGLKPRHCAVLELAGTAALSQLDLATRIGVTPSVVVDMLDELERLGAVRRVQDAADRRRRVIELTGTGHELRRHAARSAREVDTELFGVLPPSVRETLRSALTQVGAAHGLDYSLQRLGDPFPAAGIIAGRPHQERSGRVG